MQYNQAIVFIKPNEPSAIPLVKMLKEFCESRGVTLFSVLSENGLFKDSPRIEGVTTVDAMRLPEGKTLAIVFGGDGTFLTASRYLYLHDAHITGVNLGTLGFLTEVEPEDLRDHVKNIFDSCTKVEERPYFMVHVERDGKRVFSPRPIVNDAVFQRNSDERMVYYDVSINGNFVTSSKGDGIIFSTPTGSTAYNLSSGGPIVYPTMDSLVMTPICPHTLSFRPVVIPADEVRLTALSPVGHLSLDGRQNMNLDEGDTVVIRKCDRRLKIIHQCERNFYDVLRNKLRWVE